MQENSTHKETLDTKPNHYHQAPFDVMEAQGYIMGNYHDAIVAAEQYEYDGEPEPSDEQIFHLQKVWSVGAIAKHLCRLGLKDNVDVELKKIENYAHFARTGEWISE